MNHVYQLVAFAGEYDGAYELQLMVDPDLKRVRDAKNELHAAIKQAHPMDEGWVGQLAYEYSVGCLRVQVERAPWRSR